MSAGIEGVEVGEWGATAVEHWNDDSGVKW